MILEKSGKYRLDLTENIFCDAHYDCITRRWSKSESGSLFWQGEIIVVGSKQNFITTHVILSAKAL